MKLLNKHYLDTNEEVFQVNHTEEPWTLTITYYNILLLYSEIKNEST